MADGRDIIIGIDSGTSVVKAVAFTVAGMQLETASVRNRYDLPGDGSATQPLIRTWEDCTSALKRLGEKIPGLGARTLAIAVTGQGDGTWLVDRTNAPVGDAWLWLDARAAPSVERLNRSPLSRARFEATGTGLNTCQQGTQLAEMDAITPQRLDAADCALHCKDWLYLNLTGVRATDPSEASFTFGNFRTRAYDDTVIEALGLRDRRHLLPEIIDGSLVTHPLTPAAAKKTGLFAGTPVSLAYVDMAMTALGAGVYTGTPLAACSTIGSTGVHMLARPFSEVTLNAEGTGYVIALPAQDIVTQVQTNMSATLNIDWLLGVAAELLSEMGESVAAPDLVPRVDAWLKRAQPGSMLYHPYISEAGERGPFVNARARASFIGLTASHGFADLVRGVVEGVAFAMRDCYAAIGELPRELRLTGGAARSSGLRAILSAALGVPVRVSAREEAGAAGAAMMAAVANGAYPSMEACIAAWVTPLLGETEVADPVLSKLYAQLFPIYGDARKAMPALWSALSDLRGRTSRPVPSADPSF